MSRKLQIRVAAVLSAAALLFAFAPPAQAWYYPYWGYRHFYHRPFFHPYYYPFYGPRWGVGWSYYGSYADSAFDGHKGTWYYDTQRLAAKVDTDIKPNKAVVYVDGYPVGVADDFDGWTDTLHVAPGRHELVFRYPGYQPYRTEADLLPRVKINVKVALLPGQDTLQTDDRGRLADRSYADQEQERRGERRFQPPPYRRAPESQP
jgi:hypothetical protein